MTTSQLILPLISISPSPTSLSYLNNRNSSAINDKIQPFIGDKLNENNLSEMHPDNLMLQGHGVTSPRLLALNSDNSVESLNINSNNKKNTDPSTTKLINSNNSECRDSSMDENSIRSTIYFLTPPPPASATSPMIKNHNRDENDDEDDDHMSYCSEDSELSVGKEICDNNELNNNKKQNNDHRVLDDTESIISNVSDLEHQRRPLSSIINSENLATSEDLSNDSSIASTPQLDSNSLMMAAAAAAAANGLRIPVPIVRPSPTRMQEEFLRKSQLYAEELMKQQMQFMAAARASAFSLRQPAGLNHTELSKTGFRPHIKPSNGSPISPQQEPNFNGIHSHINSLTKIPANGESPLSKLKAFGLAAAAFAGSNSYSNNQREQSESPQPNYQQAAFHAHHFPFLNNQLHDSNLKFSIDNILKADFGRRITDPLLKRSSGSKKSKLERQQKLQKAVDLTSVQQTQNNNVTNNSNNNNMNMSSSSSNCSSDSIGQSSPIKSPHSTQSTDNAVPTGSGNSAAGSSGNNAESSSSGSTSSSGNPMVWPAWVYCTRYSDRPSSGRSPRTKKPKKPPSEKGSPSVPDDKRPRTAFSGPQLARLKNEFAENRYLTEKRRQQLSSELGLNEAQIKIWFQNKRAKIKKSSGNKNPLALQLMAQGLYNHSTVPLTREEEELQELQAQNAASA